MNSFFQNLRLQYERLSPKEQVLSVLLIFFLMGMFLLFGGFIAQKNLKAREDRIAKKLELLSEVYALEQDYQRKVNEQSRLSSDLQKNESVRLLSYLDNIGTKTRVDLKNLTERSGSKTGSDLVIEEAVELGLQDLSIDRLFRFLEEVEKENRLIRVRRLNIRTRFDNPKRLDAAITVGTYKPGKSPS